MSRDCLHRCRDDEFALTRNERAWVEFLRLASGDTDPAPTLKTVQLLQAMFRDARQIS
jgi:hypothetical protein